MEGSYISLINSLPLVYSTEKLKDERHLNNRFKNSEVTLVCLPKRVPFVLNFLKNHIGSQYSMLTMVSGVDFLGLNQRFCVVYELLSLTFNNRIRVKAFLAESSSVPTACFVFSNANWWEREAWDLFGILFQDHPDLRRILTDYGFEGHPLRKDFPLYGFVDYSYSEIKHTVVAEPVQLPQGFRSFESAVSW